MKLPTGKGKKREKELKQFAEEMIKLDKKIGFKSSARGWCYIMENERIIDKDKFNKVEDIINECRKKCFLPVDFVADEDARKFSGVEIPDTNTHAEHIKRYLNAVLKAEQYYTPDWWDGEEYYIQILVEKIDLKTLYSPVCKKFHIPIATGKGWSSILQLAEIARRFKEAEKKGLKCVLGYCGDLDPTGIQISDELRKNLKILSNAEWNDGETGYNPDKLEIERFGLNLGFINENKLTWIDNLKTARDEREIAKVVNGKIVPGMIKAGKDEKGKVIYKPHPSFYHPHIQKYLKEIGVRKCEANALVIRPREAEQLCRNFIEDYLGKDAEKRFEAKTEKLEEAFNDLREETGLDSAIRKAIKLIGG